jgi:rare lipoprotein A
MTTADDRAFKIQNSEFKIAAVAVLGCLLFPTGCAHREATMPSARPSAPAQTQVEEGWTEKGIASWYGEPYHGRRTASGEIYDMNQMTAAHKTLAFGTKVKVNRRDTGADVVVRINDRGPFIEGRIIDLSYAAAKKIGLDVDGVAPVKIKVVGHTDAHTAAPAASASEEAEDCFWVQVGAFSDRSNAARAEKNLEKAGHNAVMLESADGLWRVRIGPFDSEKKAEKTRNRVTRDWPGAHFVPCGG